ncbi:MAG TPA: glycosyltransferase family 2 protein [Candidatus Pelagibacter sp.]|nr:glycosyltransferase family 2 protein [Candidatus Pelagibacter sp.]
MKKDPFVDVIMPNYNKAQYLEESIGSVINQKYKNWKLIIIDNFSNDNSIKIINNFRIRENKIKLINLKKNKGVAFSRNLGIRFSKSEYIAFLDSDDYWSSEKLFEQINFMENKKYVFSYTNYTPFFLRQNIKFFKKEIIPRKSFNFDQFINDTSISTSSIIVKRSITNTVFFSKMKSLEDYYFKCKILKNGITAFRLDKNSMFYRITKKSLSSNKIRNLYLLWMVNRKYNKLSFLKSLKSVVLISISSIKKYGFK